MRFSYFSLYLDFFFFLFYNKKCLTTMTTKVQVSLMQSCNVLGEYTYMYIEKKKSLIRETKSLLTDEDSSTAAKKLLGIFFTPSRRRCRLRRLRRQGAIRQKKKKK